MPTMILVNLPVADLPRSVRFFRALGYDSDPDFSDETCAGMAISPDIYAMLLTEPFFRSFTRRQTCETATHTETMLALSCDSREEVDAFEARALGAGGSECMPPQDHGFMYARSFYDPDGHHWEIFWMDPSAAPA